MRRNVKGIATALALLACPVGMGLMMLFMDGGTWQRQASRDEPSLEDLRAEQRRITAELERRGEASHAERGVGASS
jgi:hypothetical protein